VKGRVNMKEKIAERAVKLLEVKSLVTFGIIGTVIYLAVKGTIEAKDIVLFGGMILTYFFNKDKKAE
jgi:hypothetical protein